ncbi:MAG: ABC transporter substrate-binding protein [Proteobacteria bacterium]|nr:ABC transporter substrate-binding protein [Pseudomonadota bacterium]
MRPLTRRAFGALPLALAAPALLRGRSARAADMPGVTATEIKIGNTMPYSGPASAYGNIGRAETAYFKMINDQGGINGRKVTYLSYDDGYSPPKTVEQIRRLVEQDGVSFVFNPLGTPTNTAVQRYLNQKKVPTIYVSTGADKFANPKEFPYTLPWAPSYRTEAQIYARYIQKTKPDAKIAILYQNDDFGKDYLQGAKDVYGEKFDTLVVKTASYEVTDPTVDSQLVSLKSSGANVLISATTPKFAAMVVRRTYEMEWTSALRIMSNVSASVAAVMVPAGVEKGVGFITAGYLKDPTDPTWKDDAGMNQWRGFMKRYMPEGDLADAGYVFGYGVTYTLVHALKQCGNDLTRDNILRQCYSLQDFKVPVLLPGIVVSGSADNYHLMQAMHLQKWNGKSWELFGDIIHA